MFDAGRPQNPSNVTRLVRALKQEDSQGRAQIAYYQAGVGTSWSVADKFLGGGLAYGLSENVREAYGFLVNNYFDAENDVQDDQIYFFGFSRGAFTARSVAGMCATLGLITKSAMRYFYQIFQDFENAGDSSYVSFVVLPGEHRLRITTRPLNFQNSSKTSKLRNPPAIWCPTSKHMPLS